MSLFAAGSAVLHRDRLGGRDARGVRAGRRREDRSRSSPSRTARRDQPADRRLARLRGPGDMPVAIERPNGRAGRAAAGGRSPGGAGQPERDQDLARGRGAVRRQVRRRRRRGHRRVPAAAPSPAAGRRALLRRDQGTAHGGAHPRRPGGHARRGNQPARRALLEAHWPGAKAIFADVESPIALAFLTRYPTAGQRPPASARSASRRSASRATPASARPPSCSPGCAPPRPAPRRRP